ncbi:hypothetical protein CYMTET_23341 [Cymbomonas tetramitiformis]|uniref:Uncharacterized protein n=1 Tax=Cymbomonas tetramitiformis TaxID=36881 RepID=A0AAE0FY42_9CHLO|nr:hypothetical protein CYMTET_23341 [Cymbomonas tetramitiformis]
MVQKVVQSRDRSCIIRYSSLKNLLDDYKGQIKGDSLQLPPEGSDILEKDLKEVEAALGKPHGDGSDSHKWLEALTEDKISECRSNNGAKLRVLVVRALTAGTKAPADPYAQKMMNIVSSAACMPSSQMKNVAWHKRM